MDIALLRLHQQLIATQRLATPVQIVAHLGGMQGQDLPGVKWSIGLRLPNAVQSDVDRAFDEGTIIRTWPMRGTLHVVAASDVRWMLSLTSPKNLSGSQKRRDALELDDKTLARCHQIFTKTLQGGKQKKRDEMYAALEAAGISVDGQRPVPHQPMLPCVITCSILPRISWWRFCHMPLSCRVTCRTTPTSLPSFR